MVYPSRRNAVTALEADDSHEADERPLMRSLLALIAAAMFASTCGGTTTPTPPPPPLVEDPPKISCPAAQTAQLATSSTIAVTYTATVVSGRAPVNIVCVPPSGNLFSVGQSTVTCTATDALQRTDVCAFAVTVLAAPIPKLSVTRFVAFGDSITKGEDGNAQTAPAFGFHPRAVFPDPLTYPGALKLELVDRYKTQFITVDNQGNPSEGITDTNPNTFDRFVRLTSSGSYDAVLIMEGTNDVYQARNTRDPNIVLASAEDGLHRMIQDAKNRNIRPLLATIPPMDPTAFRGMLFGWELVAGFNDRVRSVAASENVPLVDVYKAFAGNFALLSADGVHPNVGGYQKIADTFFTAITGTLEVKTLSVAPSMRRR
jgi:lysophospholipase L1-like esterase